MVLHVWVLQETMSTCAGSYMRVLLQGIFNTDSFTKTTCNPYKRDQQCWRSQQRHSNLHCTSYMAAASSHSVTLGLLLCKNLSVVVGGSGNSPFASCDTECEERENPHRVTDRIQSYVHYVFSNSIMILPLHEKKLKWQLNECTRRLARLYQGCERYDKCGREGIWRWKWYDAAAEACKCTLKLHTPMTTTLAPGNPK